jgi:hypothetical protein
MIFGPRKEEHDPASCMHDQKIIRLFHAQKAHYANRAPDFSKLTAGTRRRITNRWRPGKALSAIPGGKLAAAFGIGLILLLAGPLVVHQFISSPQADLGSYGGQARRIVSWHAPSDSLFLAHPQCRFLKAYRDWQGPTNELFTTRTRGGSLGG